MLILTRKLGESVFIDETIKVTIVSIKSGKIRLGIQAPPDVRIMRTEIEDSSFNGQTTYNKPKSFTA